MFRLVRPGWGCSLLVVSLLSCASAADAATAPTKRAVNVTAPAAGSLVDGSQIPVTVRAGSKVTAVKVFAGTKDVSRRFARKRGRFTASLPRTLLKPGTNRLLVQAKIGRKSGGTAKQTFVVARKKPATMRVSWGRQASSSISAGPAATKSYQPTNGTVPVAVKTRARTIARLTVNGRRVADARAKVSRREHSWIVSARDGLRVGRNRFRAVTYDKDGNRAVRTWTVKRDAQRPLTDVGPRERFVKPGKWTRLDASKTRATRKGAKVGYRWRIVQAPKGAKPKLIGATSARPRVKTSTPGVYQVMLRATHVKRGAKASAAATAPAAEDVVTLTAGPALPEQGQYIDTTLYGEPGEVNRVPFDTFWLNGQPYGQNDGQHINTFVQLDATTLAVIAAGDSTQVQPTPGTVTIGIWMENTVGGWAADALYGSEVWIDETPVALNATDTPPATDTSNGTSNLHGWIQPATDSQPAQWTSADMVRYQTRSGDDTATSNTMVINGQPYPVSLPAGANGGYHAVILDHTGLPSSSKVYPMTGNTGQDAITQDQLVQDLSSAPRNSTFMLQGFGTLAAIPDSSSLGNYIQNTLNGRADVVSRFNGTTDATGGVYSLVSGYDVQVDPDPDPYDPALISEYIEDETSAERTGRGSLTGILVRDPYGNDYVPLASGSATPQSAVDSIGGSDLVQLVNGAQNSWDNWVPDGNGGLRAATTGETNALNDIIAQATVIGGLSDKQQCTNAPDLLRAYYCDATADDLSDLAGQLSYQLVEHDSGYTSTDWATAKAAVVNELYNANKIWAAITSYQSILGSDDVAGAVDGNAIGQAIRDQLKQSTDETGTDMLNFLSALTDIASIDEDIGPGFTFLSGSFALLSDTFQPQNPTATLISHVQTTQATAGTELDNEYHGASEQLDDVGDYLATDPLKLLNGGRLLGNEYALSGSDVIYAQNTGILAARQFLWGAIAAPVYTMWFSPVAIGTNPLCKNDNDLSGPWHPFQNVDPAVIWPSGIGVGSGNTQYYWWPGIQGNDMVEGNDSVGLPKNITDLIFAPVNPMDKITKDSSLVAGAVMPYWAVDGLPFSVLPVAATWTLPSTDPGCYPGP